MKIYQIIIGKLPEYLEACVRSVERFCERSNHEYTVITETPSDLEDIPDGSASEYSKNRLIKDWITLDLLSSESGVMVIDWDIFLYTDFVFSPVGYPSFSTCPIDCMLYNSNRVEDFNRIRLLAGSKASVKPGTLLVGNAIRNYLTDNKKFIYHEFDQKCYMHLDNCRLSQ